MLRFGEQVSCRMFREEVARVIHHAAVWAELAGELVTVVAIGELEERGAFQTPVDLTAELAVGALEDSDPVRLAGYLARILEAAYVITVTGGIVFVEWDARRTGGGAGGGGPRAPWPAA